MLLFIGHNPEEQREFSVAFQSTYQLIAGFVSSAMYIFYDAGKRGNTAVYLQF